MDNSAAIASYRRRGAALVTALSLLVLLALMGTAYVRYMALEQEDARISVQKTRARYLAEGGIHAAVGEIQAAIREGRAPDREMEFDIPLYMQDGTSLVPTSQTVTVTLADESALININHADRAVLEALGMPRAKARELRNQLSRPGGSDIENRDWLTSVESLVTRDFVTARQYGDLATDLMTTYTVSNHRNARNFININSAPPAVMQALFNLTPEEAAGAVEQRPFTSWRDAVRKIGKPENSFNVIANAEPAREMPVELALTSRCFRIVSNVRMVNAFTTRRGMDAGIEAVVLIGEDGSHEFRYWSETPVELTEIETATVEIASDAGDEAGDAESDAEADAEGEMTEDESATDAADATGEPEAAGTPAEGETDAAPSTDVYTQEEQEPVVPDAEPQTGEPEVSDA